VIDIPCVIFAGGKSSRMGEDKSLLPFSSFKTLTEFQLSRLSKIFKNVYISTKEKNKFEFKAAFIEDIESNNTFAPTAGFVSVFAELKDEKIFVLSVDAPFIGESEIRRLLQNDNDFFDATIAQTPFGIQPLCGIYHRSLENEFTQMLSNGHHKLGHLLKKSKTNYVTFPDDKAFLNLNHPHEYKEALTLI